MIEKEKLQKPKGIWREIWVCVMLYNLTPGNGENMRPVLSLVHRRRQKGPYFFRDRQQRRGLWAWSGDIVC